MSLILIIEDEQELVKVIQSYLEQASFKVISANRGDTGLQKWQEHQPDLILLDLNLPGKDGIEVAKEIRSHDETPIIMVSARVEEIDRLIGLELGADDYITKPFSPREVVARVKTVLRRANKHSNQSQKIVRIADLEIDLTSHTVKRANELIDLTPTEFSLLSTMAEQPGRVFSRLQLLEAAQGTAYEGYERTIDAHIKNLRSKIEINPKAPLYIETVFGVGYRFSRS